MKMLLIIQRYLFVFLGFLIINCSSGTESGIVERDLVEALSWGGIDVVDESMISGLSDFIVTSNGNIAASDIRAYNIKIFSREGKLIKKVGGQGQGPEEFTQPFKITEIDNELIVYDPRNSRFTRISLNGEIIDTFKIEKRLSYNQFVFDKDRNIYWNSEGFRSEKLIEKLDNSGKIINSFGNLDGSSFEMYNFTEIKDTIKKGEIPTNLRNQLTLAISSDDKLIAVHESLTSIKKYNLDGKLIFDKSIEEPEFEEIRNVFFAKNDSIAANSYFPLRYWNDIEPDDSGGFYLLLNNSKKMTVFHYDKNCELKEKLYGPEDNISKIAIYNGELYAYGRKSLKFYVLKLQEY